MQGNIARDARRDRRVVPTSHDIRGEVPPVRDLVREELERGAADDAFPMAPARIVARHPRGAWVATTSCCATRAP